GRYGSDLLEQAQQIGITPALDNLTVADAIEAHADNGYSPPSRSDVIEWTGMSSLPDHAGNCHVPVLSAAAWLATLTNMGPELVILSSAIAEDRSPALYDFAASPPQKMDHIDIQLLIGNLSGVYASSAIAKVV